MIRATVPVRRILAVKLDGLGATLTITPALRALRETFPTARIEGLLSPAGAETLTATDLLDDRTILDPEDWSRFPADRRSVGRLARTVWSLRRRQFDQIILFHHVLTRADAWRAAALLGAIGGQRVGLALSRDWPFHVKAVDFGFGSRHEVEYWLEVVGTMGATTADRRLVVGRTPTGEAAAEALLAELGHPRVAIHPGTGAVSPARRWPLDRFAAVAARLIEVFQAEIVVVGGPAETALGRELADEIGRPVRDLTGRTDVATLAGVLGRCDVVLGNDSGVLQVAAAVGTPLVAVFGPSNDEAWRPWTGQPAEEPAHTPSGLQLNLPPVTVVRTELPCSPCFQVGPSIGLPHGCAARTCLDAITAAQVGAAVSRHLGARKRALGAAGR